MAISHRSPMRFVAFLVIMALVFGYIAWKWQEFNRQTVADDGGVPLVVVGEGSGSGSSASGDEAVPAAGGTVTAEAPEAPSSLAEARLERDRARSQRMEILKGIIDNPNVGAETRSKAEQELLTLSQRSTQEVEIENLLRARGFADAVVYLYEGAAVVVVRAESLTPAQTAQVADTVARVAGIAFDAVTVLAKPE